MNNGNFKAYAVGLLDALLVIGLLLLLSSHAEAHRGKVTEPLPVHTIGRIGPVGGVGARVSALVWSVPRTPFEGNNRPVEFIFQWPHLPSVAEQQVKMAQEKLAVYIAEQAEKAVERRKALELQADWEAFWKAVGLALMLVGGVSIVGYGWPSRTFKSPSDRGKISSKENGV